MSKNRMFAQVGVAALLLAGASTAQAQVARVNLADWKFSSDIIG